MTSRRAVALGKEDAVALTWGALGLAYLRDLDDAAAFIDQARSLNPNLSAAWHIGALIRLWLGDPEKALEYEAHAMRLSPLDPIKGPMLTAVAWAHCSAGRCDEASSWAEKAIREMPSWMPAYVVGAVSHAFGGRLAEAHKMIAGLQRLNPKFCASDLGKVFPLRRPEDLSRYAEGLRRAGLPE